MCLDGRRYSRVVAHESSLNIQETLNEKAQKCMSLNADKFVVLSEIGPLLIVYFDSSLKIVRTPK